VNLVAATATFACHWRYATARGRLTQANVTSGVIHAAHRRILRSAAAYAIALLLALAIPIPALALFLVVPVLNILPFTLDRHFRGFADPGRAN